MALRTGRLRSFRRSLGLPRSTEDLFLDFGRRNGAERVFALWSPRFAPPQIDQPRNLDVVGFPFFDPSDARRTRLASNLSAFLEQGDPPIVFTLGSFVPEVSGKFYDTSLRAARALGRRAVLLAGPEAPRIAALADRDAFVCEQAAHALLFPRSACIVHHGGIGTTAEALRAERPQLIVPFFGDQPDHGARVARLGVGASLALSRYDLARSTGALRSLLDGRHLARAGEVAREMASDIGVDAVAQWANAAAHRQLAA